MASLFMNIGNGDGSWCSIYDSKTDTYIRCAPPSYQICVGTYSGSNKYGDPYWEWYKQGWFQGSWFIDNPIPNMLKSDFIELMTEVRHIIESKYNNIEGKCPAFTGETFIEIYPKLTSCMDEIINLLIKITGNENWSYRDSYGCSLRKKLIKADEFILSYN